MLLSKGISVTITFGKRVYRMMTATLPKKSLKNSKNIGIVTRLSELDTLFE